MFLEQGTQRRHLLRSLAEPDSSDLWIGGLINALKGQVAQANLAQRVTFRRSETKPLRSLPVIARYASADAIEASKTGLRRGITCFRGAPVPKRRDSIIFFRPIATLVQRPSISCRAVLLGERQQQVDGSRPISLPVENQRVVERCCARRCCARRGDHYDTNDLGDGS